MEFLQFVRLSSSMALPLHVYVRHCLLLLPFLGLQAALAHACSIFVFGYHRQNQEATD